MTTKLKRARKRTAKGRSLERVVSRAVDRESKLQKLSRGLADMAGTLCVCGLGTVSLGKLSRALLQCNPRKNK